MKNKKRNNLAYKVFIGLPRKLYFNYLKLHREKIIFYFPKLFRFSSYPYISGDTFRKISDHILDDGEKFSPKNVKNGDIVFVQSNFIDFYFDKLNTKIKENHILISHNNFSPITEKYTNKLSDNIFCWFAENLDINTETQKLQALPLGIENKRYFNNGKLSHFKTSLVRKNSMEKEKLVLSSFAPHTNFERRAKVAEIVENINYIDIKTYPNHKEFIQNLSKYKFNICPPGMGYDTHRFWETLMVKAVPIVLRSNVINHFLKINIPMIVLEDWNELYNLQVYELEELYEKLRINFQNDEYLYFEYWLKKINVVQSKIINNNIKK